MKTDILKVMFALMDLEEDSFEIQDKRMWDFARECLQKLNDLLKESDPYKVFSFDEDVVQCIFFDKEKEE